MTIQPKSTTPIVPTQDQLNGESTIMLDSQRSNRIWQELVDVARKTSQERLPEEMTIREFAEQANISRCRARTILEKFVNDGVLEVRRIYIKEMHSECNLYRPVDKSV